MKFFRTIASLSLVKFALGAEISHENGEEIKTSELKLSNDQDNQMLTKLEDLSDDLLVEIGSYFPIPQKDLGFLKKSFYFLFFEKSPYRKFVSQRFGIPELNKFHTDKDLAWFKNLLLVKDQVHIFRAISAGMFYQKAFPSCEGPISKYISRTFRSLPPELKSQLSIDPMTLMCYFFSLLKFEDYAHIIELFKFFNESISKSIVYADLYHTTALIKQIFSVSEEENLESFKEAVKTFTLIFNNSGNNSEVKAKLLYGAIIAGIPQKVYIDIGISNPALIQDLIKIPIYIINPKLSSEESERVYEVLNIIFDRFLIAARSNENSSLETVEFVQKQISYYKILIEIGYKTDIGAEFYENVIKNGRFDFDQMRTFAKYALFSNNLSLFKQLFNDERLGKHETGDFLHNNGYLFCDFVYAIQILNFLPEDMRMMVLNTPRFYLHMIRIYQPISVNFDENEILTIIFKRNSIKINFPLPETFEYAYNSKISSITPEEMLNGLLFSKTTMDTESYFNVFTSILNCPFLKEAFDNITSNPVFTSMSVFKLFSKSAKLCELAKVTGLKFKLVHSECTELFRENILVDIDLVEFYVDLKNIFTLTTRTQIENFEKFTRTSIADILVTKLVPTLTSTNLQFEFYRYRTILHHILNGPQRNKLLELNVPVFRRMLAEEVDEKDAKFLTETLVDTTAEAEQQQVEVDQQIAEFVYH